MKEIKKIVYATDFSKTSLKAESLALLFRDKLGAELHLLHVFDPASFEMPAPYYFMPGADNWLKERLSDLRTKGESHLNEYAAELGNCQIHFLEGHPGKAIVDYVEHHDVDVIVMGTHGHTGLDRLLMGSVAEYVMRHTKAAVLTIKP